MKIQGNITISKDSRNIVRVRLQCEESRAVFAEAELTLEQFAQVITGLACVEVPIEVRNLGVVGKRKISEKRSAKFPLKYYKTEELRKWLLGNCQEEGWRIDDYLGSQTSVEYADDGAVLNYRVFRYEEISSETENNS